MASTTTTTTAKKKKATVPPAGRKLSAKEARALVHKQFGKALAMLAK